MVKADTPISRMVARVIIRAYSHHSQAPRSWSSDSYERLRWLQQKKAWWEYCVVWYNLFAVCEKYRFVGWQFKLIMKNKCMRNLQILRFYRFYDKLVFRSDYQIFHMIYKYISSNYKMLTCHRKGSKSKRKTTKLRIPTSNVVSKAKITSRMLSPTEYSFFIRVYLGRTPKSFIKRWQRTLRRDR